MQKVHLWLHGLCNVFMTQNCKRVMQKRSGLWNIVVNKANIVNLWTDDRDQILLLLNVIRLINLIESLSLYQCLLQQSENSGVRPKVLKEKKKTRVNAQLEQAHPTQYFISWKFSFRVSFYYIFLYFISDDRWLFCYLLSIYGITEAQ